jgi:hypothetical protein
MTDLWMYDAKRDDLLTALRIPVLSAPYPGWQYVVALFINDGGPYGPALRPDGDEVAQIVAYLKYRMQPYELPKGHRNRRDVAQAAAWRRRPLDTFEAANTVTLQKRSDGSWCYRRYSWRNSAPMAPAPGGEHLDLERLLDMIEGSDEAAQHWTAWKAAHPEVFR